jgi:AcrR family transcriptional regulator
MDGASERPRPITLKGLRTRERIIDAAEALFAERGYEGTTLRDVARAAGLQNPSLYNHFSSKDSLYVAVLERGIGPLLTRVQELVASGEDAAAAGAALIETVMRVLSERPAIARLVQHETLGGGQRITPMLREFVAPLFAHGTELALARSHEAGWQPEDVPLLVLVLYHAVIGFFSLAPLYRDLSGVDLLDEALRSRQARLLIELTERIFSPPGNAS